MSISSRSLLLLMTLIFAGCEGRLSVDLSRGGAPGVEQLTPRITGVELQQEGGTTLIINSDRLRELNVLALSLDDRRRLIDNNETASARYTGARLLLAPTDGRVRLDDDRQDRSLIPTPGAFAPLDASLRDDSDLTLLITLEPLFSLRTPDSSDAIGFRPVIRVTEAGNSFRITGTLNSSLVEGAECRNTTARPALGAAVYAYPENILAATDFVDGAPDNPIAAAAVGFDGAGYTYTLNQLPEGRYQVALVCDADRDRADRDDGLSALRLQTVTVDGRDRVIDFN